MAFLPVLSNISFALEPALPSGRQDKTYFISAGDIVNISVFPAEEFSREVTVQPDGTIELPLLGSIKVLGLEPQALQSLLITKFSKYVSNPQITVNVRKFSSSRVAIMGQIHNPGYYEHRDGMKILDLVASAGGLGDYAQTKKVRIFRKHKTPDGIEKEEIIYVNMAKVLDGDFNGNLALSAGDIIYVPRTRLSTTSKWLADHFTPVATLIILMITIDNAFK